MCKLKYDYTATYVPKLNMTLLHMCVFDDDDMSEFTYGVYDNLDEDEIEYHREFMYNMATDTCYHRTVAHVSIASY